MLTSEHGYLLLSTLFLLMLSGILTQGAVRVLSSQLIQLKQFSAAYQAKTALNMSNKLLKHYIENNDDQLPETGKVKTSIGEVTIRKIAENEYQSSLRLENGLTYTSDIWIDIPEVEETKEEVIDEIENETAME